MSTSDSGRGHSFIPFLEDSYSDCICVWTVSLFVSGSVPSGRGRPRSYSHILAQDEDSNSSWTSTASHSRKRKPHPPRATPLSPKLSRPVSYICLSYQFTRI